MLAADIFKALGDPTRRAVYERLAEREMSVSELKSGFPISQPAISQHLSALQSAGLVVERREGRFAYYRCDPDGLVPLIDWATHYRGFWSKRLRKLKHVLKEMDP